MTNEELIEQLKQRFPNKIEIIEGIMVSIWEIHELRLACENGFTEEQIADVISASKNGWQAMHAARMTILKLTRGVEAEIAMSKTDAVAIYPKFLDWEILDELPEGWRIDKTGSPLPCTVFITDGKSVLNGGKRALLRVKRTPPVNKPENSVANIPVANTAEIAHETIVESFPSRPVNDLARLKFKEQILKEIMFDLTVCEIESWDKKEYINEMKEMLNSINTQG